MRNNKGGAQGDQTNCRCDWWIDGGEENKKIIDTQRGSLNIGIDS